MSAIEKIKPYTNHKGNCEVFFPDTKTYPPSQGKCTCGLNETLAALEAECVWAYDDFHDYYDTDCKRAFSLITGTPKDNDYVYCPNCGRKIKVKQ